VPYGQPVQEGQPVFLVRLVVFLVRLVGLLETEAGAVIEIIEARLVGLLETEAGAVIEIIEELARLVGLLETEAGAVIEVMEEQEDTSIFIMFNYYNVKKKFINIIYIILPI
jgi:hypothetical protein